MEYPRKTMTPFWTFGAPGFEIYEESGIFIMLESDQVVISLQVPNFALQVERQNSKTRIFSIGSHIR
jgi:hypothetical protein